MRRSHLVLLIALISFVRAFAGDDASGPIHYRADFSKPFTTYVMSENDKQWSRSLIRNLKYTGNVVHFMKTSLTLEVDGSKIEHAIYQAVEKPDLFYVINGDAMLQMDQMAFQPRSCWFFHACSKISGLHRFSLPE